MEMACVYDKNVFEKFKSLSVKEVDDLVIGETYYTNSYPESFTLLALETRKQNDKRHGFNDRTYDEDEIAWAVYGRGEWDTMSLRDSNIGASYNPWMIFAREEDAIQCREELFVKIERDDMLDDYDDWGMNDYEYEDD